MSSDTDDRWICWQCADIAPLDAHGLCPACQPEPVLEFVEVCIRALAGQPPSTQQQWRIE